MASTFLDEVRRDLWQLEQKSKCARGANKFFSPAQVKRLFSADTVRKCLSELSLCKDNPRDLSLFASFISDNNSSTFALLFLDGNESHVLEFVFRRQCDSKIPYSEDALHFVPAQVAKQFLDRQQQLTPVILERGNVPREIGNDEILPFTHDELITAGGFGSVFKVLISTSCQRLLPASEGEVSRQPEEQT